MLDTEKMIIEIEQRPCLWNLSEKAFSDKFLKQRAWQEVAKNCFDDWNTLSNEDKNNKMNFLQKEWKTARDYYMREKKKANEERSGSAAKKKKSCPYFHLLQFLNVTKESRSPSSNVATPENTDNDSNLTGNDNNEENIYDQSESTSSQNLTQPLSSQPASMETSAQRNLPSTSKQTVSSQPSMSRTKNKNLMTPFQESLLNNLNRNDDYPNRYFLLSFLPEMSKMTERQNFEFRMEMMKALNKVKYQIADQPTQRNWPQFSSPFSDLHNSNQYIPSPVNRGYSTHEYNETNQYNPSNITNTFDET